MTEAEIRQLVEQGDIGGATEGAIGLYGPELYGFIQATVLNHTLADEIFQDVSISIWRYIENFRWQASLRTWVYTIARNACRQALKHPTRTRERHLYTDEANAIPARVTQTATDIWRRREAKHWLWDVITTFDPEERSIITLRIIQRMEWVDIARVLGEEDDEEGVELDEATLKRRSAALRKRYERIKARLKKLRDEHTDS